MRVSDFFRSDSPAVHRIKTIPCAGTAEGSSENEHERE